MIEETGDWKGGFSSDLTRVSEPSDRYIGGSDYMAQLDDLLFNRMIRLRNLSQSPQGYEPGKIYWDATNKKFKLWVDSTGKWADVGYTTTSTSTS